MGLLLRTCLLSVCSLILTGAHAKCASVCGSCAASHEAHNRLRRYPRPPVNAILAPHFTKTEHLCTGKERIWAQRARILLDALGMMMEGPNCTHQSAWNCGTMSRNERDVSMRFLALLPKFRFGEQRHQFNKCYVTSLAGFFDTSTSQDKLGFRGSLIYRRSTIRTIALDNYFGNPSYLVADTPDNKIRTFRLDHWNQTSPCALHELFWTHFYNDSKCTSCVTDPWVNGSNVYSGIFAQESVYNFSAYKEADHELQVLEDGVSNVREDVSASNLAILSLPLLMSLPPISLFDVSDNIVLWWVLATGVMAALPLLIKGIEVVVLVSSEHTAVNANTRQWRANPVTFFETYFVQCDEVKSDRLGIALIAIAIWLIVASCLCEYLVWRRSRFMAESKASNTEQKGLLRYAQDDEDPLPRVEKHGRPSCSTVVVQFLNRELWIGRQKWLTLLAVSYLVVSSVSSIFLGLFTYFFPLTASVIIVLGVHNVITTMVLFALHLCSSLSKLQGLMLMYGTLMGLVSGPLYIFITRFTGLRQSERWHHVTKGANLDFALMPVFLWYALPDLLNKVKYSSPFWNIRNSSPTFPVTSVMYCLCVLLVHCIRSTDIDRRLWHVCALAFFSGVIFGPFFILFRTCFPELTSDKKLTKTRVRCAGWAGFLTFLNIALLTFGFATGWICFGPCFQVGNLVRGGLV